MCKHIKLSLVCCGFLIIGLIFEAFGAVLIAIGTGKIHTAENLYVAGPVGFSFGCVAIAAGLIIMFSSVYCCGSDYENAPSLMNNDTLSPNKLTINSTKPEEGYDSEPYENVRYAHIRSTRTHTIG